MTNEAKMTVAAQRSGGSATDAARAGRWHFAPTHSIIDVQRLLEGSSTIKYRWFVLIALPTTTAVGTL
jgi:hypothetical protein